MKYEDRYFLQMQDDLGSKFDSPSFCLIRTFLNLGYEPAQTQVRSPHPIATPTEGPHAADEPQSPLAPTGKHHALHIDSPSQVTTQSSATPSPTMTTSTTPSSTSAAPSSSATTSNLLITRKSPTTAAFAIPLSVVAFVFIVAAALSFRHRHNIAKQRIEDAEKLILSRNNSKSSYKSTDAGNTLNVLTREDEAYSSAQIPVPLFMPVDLPLPRAAFQRSAKKVLPPSPTYTTPSVQGTMRSSRPLSTRSIYSQSSAYLPPIVPTSRGLFAEERENPATHSVIANYFQPSPPLSPSMPSRPVSVYAPDAESLPSQESGPAGDRPRS